MGGPSCPCIKFGCMVLVLVICKKNLQSWNLEIANITGHRMVGRFLETRTKKEPKVSKFAVLYLNAVYNILVQCSGMYMYSLRAIYSIVQYLAQCSAMYSLRAMYSMVQYLAQCSAMSSLRAMYSVVQYLVQCSAMSSLTCSAVYSIAISSAVYMHVIPDVIISYS